MKQNKNQQQPLGQKWKLHKPENAFRYGIQKNKKKNFKRANEP